MASHGASHAGPSSSSSSADSEIARLQSATSLTIQKLREMTDYFSEERKIGQGGYGKVYKAKLENGEEIAVKMLYNNTPGIDDEQFKREFENLMRLKHQNIVRLVRYCYETQHEPMEWMGKNIWTERIYRGLCFEYMQNGSLEKHISDECDGLDWLTRYKIIKGVCQGLQHLHEGLGDPIYHLDLKPDNILLDKNMVPKLADFGLSKLFSDKHTMITQSPIGTIGYVRMEFLHGNIISNKFDIFSLGVVMIKIIAGHGGYGKSTEMPRQEFLALVHENWRNRMMKACQVPRPLEAYCEQVNICTEMALSCMERDRHKRPAIADIVHRLNETEMFVDKALSLMNENLAPHQLSVKLEVLTKSEELPYEETVDEYPILVRVTAPPPWRQEEKMSRPGVDIVFAIPAGYTQYWSFDAAKDVLMMVISTLGSEDRLSIISGNGDCIMVLTFMSDKGRSLGKLLVDKLDRSYVDCELEDSVGAAAKLLRGRGVEESHSREGFIIVPFNLYQTQHDPEIISEFPVHIIRMDSENMYKYKSKDLKLLIGGITNVVATSIHITLTAHKGVLISSIDSGGYIGPVDSQRKSGELYINNIYAGETKNFIVKLKLGKGKGRLVKIGGHYLYKSKQPWPGTDVFVLRPRSGCSREKLAMNPEVAAELLRLQLVEEIKAACFLLHVVAYDDLKNILDKIMSSEEGRRTPVEALAALVKDTGLHKGQSYKGESAFSEWLDCHKWQRLFPGSQDFTLKF